jgi:3-oxoadipate enol-lactonase
MPDVKAVKTGFAELPGARLYYEMAGDGEPLVLLHGGFLDGGMWDGQFPFFAQHYQVLRHDRRCAGKSETAPSIEAYTHHQDLYHLLHALDIQRATLVGLSEGGRIAIDFTIAYPELVHKLVVVSPAVSGFAYQDEWTFKHGEAMLQALKQRDLAGAVEEFLIMWADGPSRTPEQIDPDVRARMRAMVTHAFPLSRLAPKVKYLDPPAVGRLAEIHVPTLVIVGEQDTSDVHVIGKLLQEQVAGAEVVMMADVAHTLVMEKPAELNTLVAHFLRG